MSEDNGGQAFPLSRNIDLEGNIIESFEGMTLRDYFAGQALNGIRGSKVIAEPGRIGCSDKLWSSAKVARLAYEDADAMLTERSKQRR